MFEQDAPLFAVEMQLVRPKKIVAFGQLTFSMLTGLPVKLGSYRDDVIQNGLQPLADYPLPGCKVPVYPMYFPVGRGNPKFAAELLRLLRKLPT